ADALCDMGGDLIATAAAAGHRPAGALEATTTGLHRLDGLEIPFPVLDWNGIALKDLIHNRHHVGVETWPAFTAITGLALTGRGGAVAGSPHRRSRRRRDRRRSRSRAARPGTARGVPGRRYGRRPPLSERDRH